MPDRGMPGPRDRVGPVALSYFLAVAQEGGVTAAAQLLGVSQPTVSVQMKQLRRRFPGVELLEKTDRGLVPTEAGRAMIDYATHVLATLDRLERAMEHRAGGAGGALSLGASLTSGERLLPAHIARFAAAHPEVRIEMSVGNAPKIMRLVDDRSVDIAVVGRKPIGSRYLVAPIFAERVVAFVSTRPAGSLRELPYRPIPAAELSRFPFVMRESDSGIHEQALACLHEAGCFPERIMELGSNEAVRELVRSGVGIGLLSGSAVEPELREPKVGGGVGLREVSIEPWSGARSQWLVALSGRPLSRAVREFVALLPGEGFAAGR
jgi:DNA-binding transcriptional LysR family regulator